MPWALTRHIDTFRSATDPIETALFTDGLKRVVQTKKDGTVSPVAGTAATDVMVVSGRVIFDPFGRTVEDSIPSPSRWARPAPSMPPSTRCSRPARPSTCSTASPR